MTDLRVLCLAEGDAVRGLSPASRFRVYQLLPALAREGVHVDVRPSRPTKYVMGRAHWTSSPLRRRLARGAIVGAAGVMALNRVPDILAAGGYDVVLLQRDLLPFRTVAPLLEQWVLRRNPRVVFDFDDAIFTHPGGQRRDAAGMLRDGDKIGHIVSKVRHVMAGNAYLAEFARRWNPNVTIVPTVVDTDVYAPAVRPPDDRVTIGWSGTHANFPYMLALAPIIRQLGREHPIRLRIVNTPHALPMDFGDVEVHQTWWTPATEISSLQEMDIGLMPLADDEWTRGKCGLKALQYMACGVPCVLSPVGVNAEIVTSGANGLAATTPDQWHAALRALVEDAVLRKRLGEAARHTVETRYSVRRWAPEIAAILRRVAAGSADAG